MTVKMLTDALIFLRKVNKYMENAFCQSVWDVSKCGDGDCEDCPMLALNRDEEDEDLQYLCVRAHVQEQMWKLEKCTATIIPEKEEYGACKDEDESEDGE